MVFQGRAFAALGAHPTLPSNLGSDRSGLSEARARTQRTKGPVTWSFSAPCPALAAAGPFPGWHAQQTPPPPGRLRRSLGAATQCVLPGAWSPASAASLERAACCAPGPDAGRIQTPETGAGARGLRPQGPRIPQSGSLSERMGWARRGSYSSHLHPRRERIMAAEVAQPETPTPGCDCYPGRTSFFLLLARVPGCPRLSSQD